MRYRQLTILLMALALVPLARSDTSIDVHADYYLGFSQGMYYGLMLGGVDYDVAWCVKGEVDYLGDALATGSEFQQQMDGMLAGCRDEYAAER